MAQCQVASGSRVITVDLGNREAVNADETSVAKRWAGIIKEPQRARWFNSSALIFVLHLVLVVLV